MGSGVYVTVWPLAKFWFRVLSGQNPCWSCDVKHGHRDSCINPQTRSVDHHYEHDMLITSPFCRNLQMIIAYNYYFMTLQHTGVRQIVKAHNILETRSSKRTAPSCLSHLCIFEDIKYTMATLCAHGETADNSNGAPVFEGSA